jgi:hypothetical protein
MLRQGHAGGAQTGRAMGEDKLRDRTQCPNTTTKL